MMRPYRLFVFAGLLLLVSTAVWAEHVEIVTYYPSPAAPAADTPPTKPVRFYFSQPTSHIQDMAFDTWGNRGPGVWASPASVDLFQTLQLWRYGVTRSQMRMTDWGGCMEGADIGCPKQITWNAPGVIRVITFVAPDFNQGVVSGRQLVWTRARTIDHTEAPQIYEIIVDWTD